MWCDWPLKSVECMNTRFTLHHFALNLFVLYCISLSFIALCYTLLQCIASQLINRNIPHDGSPFWVLVDNETFENKSESYRFCYRPCSPLFSYTCNTLPSTALTWVAWHSFAINCNAQLYDKLYFSMHHYISANCIYFCFSAEDRNISHQTAQFWRIELNQIAIHTNTMQWIPN